MRIRKIIDLGDCIEVENIHSSRYGKRGGKNAPKTKPTPEQMMKVNERNAIKYLRRLLILNFKFGDLHVVLKYKKDNRPTASEAKKIFKKFMKELRKEYKRFGVELKYVFATEYKNAGIHHHLIVNETPDTIIAATKIISKLWRGGGSPYYTTLYEGGQYGDLAAYIVKETEKTFRDDDSPCKKRWTPSRNMIKPEVKTEILPANNWAKKPTPPDGYYIDINSIVEGVSEITGYPYQYYTLVKYKENSGMDGENWIRPRKKKGRYKLT